MWHYNSSPLINIPDQAIGFVYEITNNSNNKKYIGKKLFYSTKTIQKNLKKKKIKVESNWKEYNGSNKTLLIDIENSNPTLEKTILKICYSKSECSYYEAFYQFQSNCILSPNYYNDWISLKVTRKHLSKIQFLDS